MVLVAVVVVVVGAPQMKQKKKHFNKETDIKAMRYDDEEEENCF